jgi:hypothetical protein
MDAAGEGLLYDEFAGGILSWVNPRFRIQYRAHCLVVITRNDFQHDFAHDFPLVELDTDD